MREGRRIRKTRSSIKQAFTRLLQEKDLEKITIRDITTRADINRGTFYLYYRGKHMLPAGIEDEYISELTTCTQFDSLRGSSIKDAANTFVDNILKNIFQHIYDNLEFYHTILQLKRTSQLELKTNEHIKSNIQRYVNINHSIGGVPKTYSYSYVSGITISVIKYWITGKQSVSVDELAKHVHNTIFSGPLRIMTENRLHKSNLDSLTQVILVFPESFRKGLYTMIISFRHSEDIDKHIIETPLDHTTSWANVVEPDREEVENLMEQYNIPEDFIHDPLDPEESSCVEYDEDIGHSLIIIDLPIANSTSHSALFSVAIPLDIIIGNGTIVTICDAESEFLENLPKRDINLKLRSRSVPKILITTADHYNRSLRLLSKSRIHIEKELKNNIANKQFFRLMGVEKSPVYFLAALKGNDTVIKKLSHLPAIKRFEEDEGLLEDLVVENNQAIETTELHQRILENITTSCASLLSNDMNTITRILTFFTILLALPTSALSFFGIDVPLPIDDHSYIPWIIVVGISLILVVIVSIFLWRKQKL